VISISFFAGHAGEVMHIVVIHVVLPENLKTKEKHREDIAKLKKGKRTTGKPKTVGDTG
jgi:hypothetical protein